MADEPVPAMLTVSGKRFACERCGASVFTRIGESYACNGCGTGYGSGASTLPLARPPRYSFTRDQLIEAFKRFDGDAKVALFRAGFDAPSMADAIIAALGGQIAVKFNVNPEYRAASADAESEGD